ncbi:hypothetical protein HD554DRAFT_2077748 [Boletus coccyginus]|nr:hypothetical protein HD554DRAFT_2077748 [Boletus coccyginus]
MYLLGCHCLVALYISTDCLRVETRAKSKSVTLRNICGIIVDKQMCDGALMDSKALQAEKLRTWTTMTGGKRWKAHLCEI